jgi:hypothetical protein
MLKTTDIESKKPTEDRRLSFTDQGQVVMTRGVTDRIEKDELYGKWVNDCLLQRYCKCDWGDLSQADKDLSDEAIDRVGYEGKRVIARYNYPGGGDIYIITKKDRSVTKILFPSEY